MFLREISGFSLALAAMFLYGLYMVPRKKSRISQSAFTFWMGFGILISTAIIGAVFGHIGRVGLANYLIMFASGVLWGTGTLGYSLSIKCLGISRSTPIKNTSAIMATVFGVVIFHEFTLSHALPLACVIAGSLAIVISATILARVEAPDVDEDAPPEHSRPFVGVLFALWAAVAYSVYTIPMKYAYTQGVTPAGFLFYMGQGVFVGMALLALIMRRYSDGAPVTLRECGLAQLSGVMWAVGSICANLSVKYIGIAITWPITKMTLVAVLYGVIVLKEVDMVKHKKSLVWGLSLSVVGMVLLALAIV